MSRTDTDLHRQSQTHGRSRTGHRLRRSVCLCESVCVSVSPCVYAGWWKALGHLNRVDGHRGDIIIMKTAKPLSALNSRKDVLKEDVDAAGEPALPHRIRRQPLQDIVVDVKQMRQKEAVNG